MLLMKPLIEIRHMHNPMRPIKEKIIRQHKKPHLPNNLPLPWELLLAEPEIHRGKSGGQYEQVLKQYVKGDRVDQFGQ